MTLGNSSPPNFGHASAVRVLVLALIMTSCSMPAMFARAADTEQPLPSRIAVMTDHAVVLRLPMRTSTVIVGNPTIADVSIERNGTAVFTGKSYGVTNVIVQDAAGATLAETIVRVTAKTEGIVVLHRGLDRESYVCLDRCEAAPSLGDREGFFTGVHSQVSTRSNLAK